jgi:hypothetical protein
MADRKSALRLLFERIGYYRHSESVALPDRHDGKGRCRLSIQPGCSPTLALRLTAAWRELCQTQALRSGLADIRRRHKRHLFLEHPIVLDGKCFLAKYYAFKGFKRKLQSSFFFSEARRNEATMRFLEANGILVARPAAILNVSRFGIIQDAVLFMEQLGGDLFDYKQFFSSLGDEPASVRLNFFSCLAKDLGSLHLLGIHTDDMDKNTLVKRTEENFRFYYSDFDNVFPWRTPTFKRTYRALLHYLGPQYELPFDELVHFIDGYLETRKKEEWRSELIEVFKEHRPHLTD